MTQPRRQSARSRRHHHAMRILEQQRRERIAAGEPEPAWYQGPYAAILTGGLGVATVAGVAWGVTSLPAEASLGIAIAAVVAIGAGGLVLRGLGEILPATDAFPRRKESLKGLGYFVGAVAYAATAAVALINGLRLLG